MNEQGKSVKHSLISKSNTSMFIMLGVAGAVVSFSLVTGLTLVKRMKYQSKVINQRVSVEKKLAANVIAVDSLVTAYKAFDGAKESSIGTADANSKIVLDALPSKYDFPALATSLEKILTSGGLNSISITGSDAELSAAQNSAQPIPVEIPFSLSAKGPYTNIQLLLATLQRSIRPFKILKIDLTGRQNDLNVDISAVTYYQPEKNLEIPLKEVP